MERFKWRFKQCKSLLIGVLLIWLIIGGFQNCGQGFSAATFQSEPIASGSPAFPTVAASSAWVGTDWSTCSVLCGGGTQTRTLNCAGIGGSVVAASFCAAGQPPTTRSCNTQACTFPKPFQCLPNAEPINAQYRIMLGRSASPQELLQVAQTIVAGNQWAYFEPYPTYAPYNHSPSNRTLCMTWTGTTENPLYAGIPYQTLAGLNGISEQDEFAARGGADGQLVNALYRTHFCALPSISQLQKYLAYYRSNKNDPPSSPAIDQTGAQVLIGQMQKDAHAAGVLAPCWDAVTDVMMRVLGRPPMQTGCNITSTSSPDPNTPDPGIPGSVNSCYWLWQLAHGYIAPNDLAHGVRSTQEAMRLNENPQCYAQFAVSGSYGPTYFPQFALNPLTSQGAVRVKQNDPHAIGEYIRQLYVLLLRREPGCFSGQGALVPCASAQAQTSELAIEVTAYSATGGDPAPVLHGIADRITNPANPQNAAAQYAKFGGYAEYVSACAAINH